MDVRTPEELVAAYAEAHNAGVRTRDFTALGALLHPTASMRFRGGTAGPYDNAIAIVRAFREQGPTDELRVLQVRRAGENNAVATYAWSEDPGRAAGRLHLAARRGLISSIRVEVFG